MPTPSQQLLAAKASYDRWANDNDAQPVERELAWPHAVECLGDLETDITAVLAEFPDDPQAVRLIGAKAIQAIRGWQTTRARAVARERVAVGI